MRTIIATITIVASVAAAQAGCRYQTIGNFTYIYCDGQPTVVCQTIGSYTYCN